MKGNDVHPAAWALCVAMVFAVAGLFVLVYQQKAVPDLYGWVVTGLVTAVGTILAKTRRDSTEPTDVQVVNPPGQPVPVEEA